LGTFHSGDSSDCGIVGKYCSSEEQAYSIFRVPSCDENNTVALKMVMFPFTVPTDPNCPPPPLHFHRSPSLQLVDMNQTIPHPVHFNILGLT
jgi:hypothetical protein